MMVVVSYDVRTEDRSGARRLRRIAKICKDFGQRVQYSVFECVLDPAQWTLMRQRLIEVMDMEQDSLRFYFMGANWKNRVEHVGAKEVLDVEGPLIV